MTEGEKVKNKSIKKNFIYNSILTSANIVFPLITAPYLSYTLGAENIGKVNFATSIVNWFILISSFGIPRYGIREIARNRDNKKELTNTFWNLILIQASLSIIAIIVYLLAIFNVPRFESELNIHLMMVMMLILNVFSIDWFYQGIEEYKRTAGAVLLDVRTPQEYQEGHIPESKNVPLQQLNNIVSVVKNTEIPLFVYCYSGARSRQATGMLQRMGYSKVNNIGGIAAYSGKVEK